MQISEIGQSIYPLAHRSSASSTAPPPAAPRRVLCDRPTKFVIVLRILRRRPRKQPCRLPVRDAAWSGACCPPRNSGGTDGGAGKLNFCGSPENSRQASYNFFLGRLIFKTAVYRSEMAVAYRYPQALGREGGGDGGYDPVPVYASPDFQRLLLGFFFFPPI